MNNNFYIGQVSFVGHDVDDNKIFLICSDPIFSGLFKNGSVSKDTFIQKFKQTSFAELQYKKALEATQVNQNVFGPVSFSVALAAIKLGAKAQRFEWNFSNKFIWYIPPSTIKADVVSDPDLRALIEANGGEMKGNGFIRMCDGKITTGWIPSQEDMSEDDWYILE